MSTWIELAFTFPQGIRDVDGAFFYTHAIKRPHVTVLHLGDVCDSVDEDLLRKLAQKIWTDLPQEGIRARVDGYGTFILTGEGFPAPRHVPVWLVNSFDLLRARQVCEKAVLSYGFTYEFTYGFQPHVALRAPFELKEPFDLKETKLQLVRKRDDETTFFEIAA